MAIYANVDAARFYERAVARRPPAARRAGGGPRRRLRAARRRCGIRSASSGAPHEAFRRRADARARSAATRAGSSPKEAKLMTRHGSYPAALRRADPRAERSSRAMTGRQAAAHRAGLYGWYAAVRFRQRSLARCDRLVRAWRARRRCGAAAEMHWPTRTCPRHRAPDARRHEHGPLLAGRWRSTRSSGDVRRAGERSEQHGQRRLRGRAGGTESRRGLRACPSTLRDDGRPVECRVATYNIAEILSDQGRYDDAEPLLRDVIRVWRASGAARRSPMQRASSGARWRVVGTSTTAGSCSSPHGAEQLARR